MSLRPWLIVAGGVDDRGGMDKANLALARYLVRQGRDVHLVAHRVDQALSKEPNVRVHIAPSPLGSTLLGERFLDSTGRSVGRRLLMQRAVVLTNGGNLAWSGVNWVHSVHHAWNRVDAGAPLWFRMKNRIAKSNAQRREARSFAASRLIIANSDRTRADIERVASTANRAVETVYLGSDAASHATTLEERARARSALALPRDLPVALFVGALSHDNNKGLDVLIDAWRLSVERLARPARLLIAGGGSAVEAWRTRVAQDKTLADSTAILGYRADIQTLYDAADVLVAPSRYEAYGLAAHEAICSGLPVITGKKSGIAERFPPALREILLSDPTDVRALASRLDAWQLEGASLRSRFAPFADALRSYTWDDMASRIVDLADEQG